MTSRPVAGTACRPPRDFATAQQRIAGRSPAFWREVKGDAEQQKRSDGSVVRDLRAAIGASALTIVCVQTAAQDQSPQPAAPLETIIVTGSRIVVPGVAVSNPVTSIDAEAIKNSGVTDLTDYLKTTPALVSSTDKTDAAGSTFIGGTGLTLLNLRNLGVDRTLVLVDGRRHVAGLPGSAAVDIDTIPFALIDRIDVQTGGASALYGADGVSGVVNFILKHDFEGVDVRAQYGSSSQRRCRYRAGVRRAWRERRRRTRQHHRCARVQQGAAAARERA